jgi:uncharacterized protein
VELARRSLEVVDEYLREFRAVVISGPRQSGKTTLIRQLVTERRRLGHEPALDVRTFDDPTELAAAQLDPITYVSQLCAPSAIDEFQRGGDGFLLAAKMRLDGDRSRGQLVMAGSTSFLTSKTVADSLAGRVGVVDLWPLSVGEAEGIDGGETFIDRVFTSPASLGEWTLPAVSRAQIANVIVGGGFPEPLTMSARARANWFRSYLSTVATKDVIEEVGEVRKLSGFRRVLDLVIARTAHEANAAAIAADAALHPTTVAHHIELLRNLMIVHELPAWASSATSKAKRHPKRYAVDTGLAAAVLGVDSQSLGDVRSPLFGQLFETFVVNELAKQRTWARTNVRLHHFRDRAGAEVDVVIVGPGQRLLAIEVKGSASLSVADARHLIAMRDRVGEPFVHGVVLYLGHQTVSLGDRITALPVSALWAP